MALLEHGLVVGLAHVLANTKCICLRGRIYSNRNHKCNRKRNHSTCDRGWETSFLDKCSHLRNTDKNHLYKRMAMCRCASDASVSNESKKMFVTFYLKSDNVPRTYTKVFLCGTGKGGKQSKP